MDYAQARYYGSSMGRFIGVDPLGSSAKKVDPQTMNRYSYALNNPLRYIDPDGKKPDGHSPWLALDEFTKGRLTRLLVPRGPDGTMPTGKEADKIAMNNFNRLVTANNKDGTLDEEQTNLNAKSVANFVNSLSQDALNSVQTIEQVIPDGKGGSSTIKFTANSYSFQQALLHEKDSKGYNRFVYLGAEGGHIDSIREVGYSVSDISLHFDQPDPNVFTAHWDPTTAFTHTTLTEVVKDVLVGPQRRLYAGAAHWVLPHASPERVTQQLKDTHRIPE